MITFCLFKVFSKDCVGVSRRRSSSELFCIDIFHLVQRVAFIGLLIFAFEQTSAIYLSLIDFTAFCGIIAAG